MCEVKETTRRGSVDDVETFEGLAVRSPEGHSSRTISTEDDKCVSGWRDRLSVAIGARKTTNPGVPVLTRKQLLQPTEKGQRRVEGKSDDQNMIDEAVSGSVSSERADVVCPCVCESVSVCV